MRNNYAIEGRQLCAVGTITRDIIVLTSMRPHPIEWGPYQRPASKLNTINSSIQAASSSYSKLERTETKCMHQAGIPPCDLIRGSFGAQMDAYIGAHNEQQAGPERPTTIATSFK